jgi:acyl phosphate:glycerol-3-phosphate acyltransferase
MTRLALLWLGAIVAGYLCGSVPWAFLIARKKLRIDIREHGSGNVGATNLWRVGGWKLGLAGFALDVLKGFLPVMVFHHYGYERVAIAAGLAAVIGHMYPVWLKGSGGKGVATASGMFLALAPLPMLYALLTFLVVGPLATRTVSAGSIAAAVILPFAAAQYASTDLIVITALVGALTIYRHRANIVRLYNGTENRVWTGLDC